MFEGRGVGVARWRSSPMGVSVGRPYGAGAGWSVDPVPDTVTPPVEPELWQARREASAGAASQIFGRTPEVYAPTAVTRFR